MGTIADMAYATVQLPQSYPGLDSGSSNSMQQSGQQIGKGLQKAFATPQAPAASPGMSMGDQSMQPAGGGGGGDIIQQDPYLTTSDENAKTNIEPADKPIDDFLDNLGAHQYEYKNKKDGAGEYVSPMAQEIEKTVIGKSAVIDTPEGKKVDYARLVGASLSALAIHHQDIKKMNRSIEALKAAIKVKK